MNAQIDEQPAPLARYSYSSVTGTSLLTRARDLWLLAKSARREMTADVAVTVNTVQVTKQRVFERTGVRLERLKVLEVGPGQLLRHLRCFAVDNDAVGIDTDVIPQGASLADYARLIRHSPWSRTIKTIGRKALGKDARFHRCLGQALSRPQFGRLPIKRMSATEMTFPEGTFDFVASYSVFEHIDDPAAALREVKRVLKPGGVAYISVHLYTSHSGAHDLSTMGGDPKPPYWAHLRPETSHTVCPSAYLNRFRLTDWRRVFDEVMPGTTFYSEQQTVLAPALEQLRRCGELIGYTDDELLTVDLVGLWQKEKAAPISRRSPEGSTNRSVFLNVPVAAGPPPSSRRGDVEADLCV